MLFIAFALVVGVDVLLYLGQSNHLGPMFDEPPPVVGWLIPAIGVAAQALGLGWMIRIYRADPEAAPSSWRLKRP
jgi:hypothetical protein